MVVNFLQNRPVSLQSLHRGDIVREMLFWQMSDGRFKGRQAGTSACTCPLPDSLGKGATLHAAHRLPGAKCRKGFKD